MERIFQLARPRSAADLRTYMAEAGAEGAGGAPAAARPASPRPASPRILQLASHSHPLHSGGRRAMSATREGQPRAQSPAEARPASPRPARPLSPHMESLARPSPPRATRPNFLAIRKANNEGKYGKEHGKRPPFRGSLDIFHHEEYEVARPRRRQPSPPPITAATLNERVARAHGERNGRERGTFKDSIKL